MVRQTTRLCPPLFPGRFPLAGLACVLHGFLIGTHQQDHRLPLYPLWVLDSAPIEVCLTCTMGIQFLVEHASSSMHACMHVVDQVMVHPHM